MEKITEAGELIAIVHRSGDWKEGLDFLTPDEAFCQVGTWNYNAGKELNAHRHINNERPNNLTQECVIVMHGRMEVELFDLNDKPFHKVVLETGDLMIMLAGGHAYSILADDTRIIECKNGPFISVEKDKVLIER